jgi:hypothetical protein
MPLLQDNRPTPPHDSISIMATFWCRILSLHLPTIALVGSVALSVPVFAAAPFKDVQDLDNCLRQELADSCLEQLHAFTKANPASALAAARLARRSFKSWAALAFYEQGLSPQNANTVCLEEDLALAVVSGLSLPSSYPAVATAQRLSVGLCAQALEPALSRALKEDGPKSYLGEKLCASSFSNSRLCVPPAVVTEPEAVADTTPAAAPIDLPNLTLKESKLGVVKVLLGSEGERVTLIEVLNHPGLFWLKRSNIAGAPEQTKLHRLSVHSGRETYSTEHGGGSFTSLIRTPRSYGAADWTLYLEDGSTVPLRYDLAASKQAETANMRGEHSKPRR